MASDNPGAVHYHRHQYTNEKREALALWGKEVMQIVAKYPAEAKSG